MPKDLTLIIVTLIAIILSAAIDRQRTLCGVQKGWKMLCKLFPHFLLLLVLVSIFLALVPQEMLVRILGTNSMVIAPIAAAVLGSIALIPGPIVYPLAGMLKQSGASPVALAVFITTLMMVGVLSFPVEKEYFGIRVALLRNVLSFFGALVIGFAAGMVL